MENHPFENKLQQIAAEMAMLSPGSDDGLIPLFALSGEILDLEDLDEIWIRPMETLQSLLDVYLDTGNPVDEEGILKFRQFDEWINEALFKSSSGAALPPLPSDQDAPATTASRPSETSEKTTPSPNEAKLNRIAAELDQLKVGSDEGLIPLFSLSGELLDSDGLPDALTRSMEQLQGMLNEFLNAGHSMTEAGIVRFKKFREWLLRALQDDREGSPIQPLSFTEAELNTEVPEEPKRATPPNSGPAPITSTVVAPDEEILVIDTRDDVSLLQEYFQEAMEHLDSIEGYLLTLESNPRDTEGLAAVFRAFHSVKGVAGFLQLKPIQRLAHQVESLLDLARNNEIILNSHLITLILQSCDSVKEMTNLVGLALEKGSVPDTHFPIAALVQEIEQTTEATLNGTLDQAAPRKPAARPSEDLSESVSPGSAKAKARTTRVASERINNLMDVVGELVILESQLMQSAKDFIGSNTLLQRQFSQLQRILKDLQHTSMALQMVPIKPTFQRVERIVRDLSQKLNKEIELHISGEDTELDRTVVELINDPLVHMIRNAADHGLESTADRVAAGKSSVGHIQLKAYHMGSTIVIELNDDGAGIDPRKIRQKAIEKELISPDAVLTHEEALQLIFAPGFSTAAVLTEQSGRGVGMDVVKRNIDAMRGVVSIESTVGKGTNFKIKLPLTTAIIDGLIVRVGKDKFIIPTHTVQVTLRPKAKQLTRIANQREMLIMKDRTVPVIRLNHFLGIADGEQDPTNAALAIVESVGKHYALMVDEMIQKQEVVIKPLGDVVGKLQGIAGGAILGDGSIALILDPAALVKQEVA